MNIQTTIKEEFPVSPDNKYNTTIKKEYYMTLYSQKITPSEAFEILKWHYDPPYDFYNCEPDEEGVKELLNNGYNAVVNEKGDLIGFYCSGASAQVPAGRHAGVYNDEAIDIGIGMRPDLTGRGYGRIFFDFVLQIISDSFPDKISRLTVARFNERAIKLYQNMGFLYQSEFSNGKVIFFTMVKV